MAQQAASLEVGLCEHLLSCGSMSFEKVARNWCVC